MVAPRARLAQVPSQHAERQRHSVGDCSAGRLHQTLVEQAQVGLFMVQNRRFGFVNPKLAEMFGYSVAEMMAGVDPYALVTPACRAVVARKVRERLTGTPDTPYEVVCETRDGRTFDARIWAIRVEVDGAAADIVTVHDIGELKRATRAAELRTVQLAQAEELARIGSKETDLITGEVTMSAGLYRLFGVTPGAEPVNAGWLYARVPTEERGIVQSIREGVQPGERFEFQHRIVHADGSLRTVLHRGLVEADATGRPVRTRAILQDITAQREAERALHDLTHLDPVTELPNRHALLAAFDDATLAAQREQRSIGLLVLTIDQFRVAKETLGYAGGDALLKAVTQRLLEAPVPLSVLAHLGSGEFAAVLDPLPLPCEAAAQRQAYGLIQALAAPFDVAGNEIFVSCSVGVALYPTDACAAAVLLDQAQNAMRQAHAWGSNHVFFYTAEASERATGRLAAESALRHAQERRELYLCYQPQVDLRSGRIIGLEALARWNHPGRGEVSPAEFIPLAEQTGLIVPIGEWVLRTACEDSVRWQAAGLPPVRVAVNLSMVQLEQADIVQRIQTILLETGLHPQHLGVELTESMLLKDVAHVAQTLNALKAMGIEIALDDFGTGYSNLSYLGRLPIDVLKIDRAFVHEATAAAEDVSITRALINLAHSLHMTVLAEGVENESQLALLVASHCDQMQGFYFSRPVRPEAIEAMLRDDKRLPESLLARRAGQRTLLLVDDEENIIASLRRLLRRDGYRILTASSGAEGLRQLAENEVDVIVSDQRMPGMTGVEFLRRAKELYPETVRLSLSGYTELQSITDAINEGAIYKFLTKPWDDERLRAHIDEAFRQKATADEHRRLADRLQAAHDELARVNQRLEALLAEQDKQMRRVEAYRANTQALLESVPAAVVGFDPDGLLTFVNPEALRVFPQLAADLASKAGEGQAPEAARLWQLGLGEFTQVPIGQGHWRVVARSIDDGCAEPRGRMLVVTP